MKKSIKVLIIVALSLVALFLVVGSVKAEPISKYTPTILTENGQIYVSHGEFVRADGKVPISYEFIVKVNDVEVLRQTATDPTIPIGVSVELYTSYDMQLTVKATYEGGFSHQLGQSRRTYEYIPNVITVTFIDAETREPLEGTAVVTNESGFRAEVGNNGTVEVRPSDYLITPLTVPEGYDLPEAQERYVLDYEKVNNVTFEVAKTPIPVVPEPKEEPKIEPTTPAPIEPQKGEVKVTPEAPKEDTQKVYKTLPKTGGVPEHITIPFISLLSFGVGFGIAWLVRRVAELEKRDKNE